MSIRAFLRRTHPPYGWAGVFCASGIEIILGEIAELPAGLGTLRHLKIPKPGGQFGVHLHEHSGFFLRRTHPPYGWADWERCATSRFPNRAGNPAFTSMSIRTFFAPDTPALRLGEGLALDFTLRLAEQLRNSGENRS
jgi:hypothetical protein